MNPAYSRRVRNEIARDWTELYQEKSKTLIVNETHHELTFFMYFDNIKHPIIITVDFSQSCYPFKPPKIYIGYNKKDYISLLPTTWSFSKKILGDELCLLQFYIMFLGTQLYHNSYNERNKK